MPGFVFVSYSRTDADYVGRLVEHLQNAGLTVWLDTGRLEYGDRWETVIREQVDACAALIIVMSPTAEGSVNVANELSRARRKRKPLLPVLLSGELFFAVSSLNYFDARGGELPTARFIDRIREITDGVDAQPAPPEAAVVTPAAPPAVSRTAELGEIASALTQLPEFTSSQGRQQILQALPPTIRGSIEDAPNARMHAINIVRGCARFGEQGRTALLESLELVLPEGDPAAEKAIALIRSSRMFG